MHALTTLNDVTYVEAARALAQRVLKSATPVDERLELAFRLILARGPSAAEWPVLRGSLERVRREFAANPAAAKQLLGIGESKRDEVLDAVEHAAYTAVCSAILNLDEGADEGVMAVDPLTENRLHVTRREFFGRSACGLGTAGAGGIVVSCKPQAAGLHFPAKAKHVIYLFQMALPRTSICSITSRS